MLRRRILLLILTLTLAVTGVVLKDKIVFYYATYLKEKKRHRLTNTEREQRRIDRIINDHSGNVFGIDISHYQRREDIDWKTLNIANGAIDIRFVVLRATMGNRAADKHFDEFWEKAATNDLIRGAYHFYRPDEDPVMQANSYLLRVRLSAGDLRPVLDVEKLPRKKTRKQFIEDLKVWLRIVEDAYGAKPILYTYYHFYKDFLREDFADYPLWLANYNDVPAPSPADEWLMWQFTENGIVDGIGTKVDLNVINGGDRVLNRLRME